MTRQRMGEKKVARLREQLGLPIVKVLVRGNTGHRKDLCLEDGTVVSLYKDGTLEKTDIGWRPAGLDFTPRS